MLHEIFLIRHGDPDTSQKIPYTVPPGPDLSAKGRQEAQVAAEFLAQHQLEHLFISPFARTTQTAEIIIERLGLAHTYTSLVQEHGPHEGFGDVRTRLSELLAGAEDSPFTTIGLVTHGSPVRAMLQLLTNNQIDLRSYNFPGGNPAPTCGIWRAQRNAEGLWQCALIFEPAKTLTP